MCVIFDCNIRTTSLVEKSEMELKYSRDSMDWASERENIEVLYWWKKSGLELKLKYEGK